MVNRAFQYDLSSEKWVECTDENFINADIEKISSVLVLNYFELPYYVYCPKHHRIENIFNSVESGNSEIISDEGCKFQDSDRLIDKKILYCPIHKQLEEIILIDGNEIITDTFCKFNGLIGFGDYNKNLIPFRWRIFQSEDKNFVNIAVDVSRSKGTNSGMVKHWKNFFISVSVSKGRYFINNLQLLKIPKIVEDAAMETLLESTKNFYGFKPTVITKFEGKEKIFAYIERPFDVNIILLKNFFADFGDFDKIFPYECTDNYKIICRLLEINPPKSLLKAYAKNPYAIIWYMIFKQLGVKDVNFMQKFFSLDECITVLPLDEFRLTSKKKQVVKMTYSERWRAFEYFCKCLIKERSEKFFMNWLYKFSTKENLTQNQIDIFEMFYKYEEHISEELKTKLFKNGLTWYIHDAMSAEVADYLQNRNNVKIFYEEKVLNCEGTVNGYEFKVVKETKDLYYIGLELANCVASYRQSVLNLNSIIFVVFQNEKLVACIEVCDGEIIQALGYHNQVLNDELEFTVKEWQNLKKIQNLQNVKADFSQKPKVYVKPKMENVGRNDMITQAEIDALLSGDDFEYD